MRWKILSSDLHAVEYVWIPTVHAEINTMKVLVFSTRAHVIVPTALPSWYEEALRDEEGKSQGKIAARVGSTAI